MNAENTLELNEGLAEYTAVMLSSSKDIDLKDHFSQRIDDFYENPTFVRSFAYNTIPVYGYLLAQRNKAWHKEISKATMLTNYMIDAFSINVNDLKSYQEIEELADYHYAEILEIEGNREKERIAQVKYYKAIYSNPAALTLYFENMNISFDPRNLFPLEGMGTVYPNIRVTDSWGILTADRGALISDTWGSITVSQPTNLSDTIIEGKGWRLELNKEWVIIEQDGVFELINQGTTK